MQRIRNDSVGIKLSLKLFLQGVAPQLEPSPPKPKVLYVWSSFTFKLGYSHEHLDKKKKKHKYLQKKLYTKLTYFGHHK